jgi:hypothetical protein
VGHVIFSALATGVNVIVPVQVVTAYSAALVGMVGTCVLVLGSHAMSVSAAAFVPLSFLSRLGGAELKAD